MNAYDTGTLSIPEEVTSILESEGRRISYAKSRRSRRNERTAHAKALGWKGAAPTGESAGSALWPDIDVCADVSVYVSC